MSAKHSIHKIVAMAPIFIFSMHSIHYSCYNITMLFFRKFFVVLLFVFLVVSVFLSVFFFAQVKDSVPDKDDENTKLIHDYQNMTF